MVVLKIVLLNKNLYICYKSFRSIIKNIISIFVLFAFCLALNGQVKIKGKVTLANGAIMVVEDQDIILEEEIQGDGKIILKKSENSNAKIQVGKKILSENDNLDDSRYAIQVAPSSSPEVEKSQEIWVANKPKKSVFMSVQESLLELETIKLGSLSISPLDKEIKDGLPIAFISNNFFGSNFVLFDNYIIPDINYILITKEPIMSSQNMHDTLFISSVLDPPKFIV